MNDIVTADFSQFGYRELQDAAELLQAYAEHKGNTHFLGDNLTVNFNMYSGIVFLLDEDYNVGVLEDNQIVQFYTCPECGYEGTQQDAREEIKDFEANEGYCSPACKTKNT